jgi:hypothetical protein
LLGTEAFAGPRRDGDDHADSEQVAADRPLGGRHHGVQALRNVVDRHVDDGRVERDHDDPDQQDHRQLDELGIQPLLLGPASGGAAALTGAPIYRHKRRHPHLMMARNKMHKAHLVVMVVG